MVFDAIKYVIYVYATFEAHHVSFFTPVQRVFTNWNDFSSHYVSSVRHDDVSRRSSGVAREDRHTSVSVSSDRVRTRVMTAAPEEMTTTSEKPTSQQKISRPQKPDRSAFEAKIASLVEITDAKQRRIEEIKTLVNAKKTDRKDHNAANAPLLDKLKAMNAICNEKIAQRDALRDAMNATSERRDKVREEVNAMRSASKFLTNESIDAEVMRIEGRLAHETMPLAQEKKLIEQIKSLNKNRENVKAYAEKQAIVASHEATRKAQMEKIRAKDAEINSIKAEQAKIRSKLDGEKGKMDAKNADVPALTEEKSAAYEVIKKTREEINKLRSEQKEIEDAYWAREKLYRAQQKEIKQAQWEAQQEERKAREEARKKWELENAPEPFEDEISACDTLVTYLSKWDSSASKENEPVEKSVEQIDKALEGMVLLKRDDDDDMFAVSNSYKKKNKKNGSGKTVPSGNERIQHSLDTLAFFAKIQVAVVAKAADVPSALVSIKAKKEEYLEKRRIKKEKIAAGEVDEEETVAPTDGEEKAENAKRRANKKGGKKKGGDFRRPISVTLTVKDEDKVLVSVTIDEPSSK